MRHESHVLGFRGIAPPICSNVPRAFSTSRWARCHAWQTAGRCGSDGYLNSTAEFILKHTILEEGRPVQHATTVLQFWDNWRPPRSLHVTRTRLGMGSSHEDSLSEELRNQGYPAEREYYSRMFLVLRLGGELGLAGCLEFPFIFTDSDSQPWIAFICPKPNSPPR